MKEGETGCCPKFNPNPWDEKTIIWKNKLFIKDRVYSFFHIPLNFGKVMEKISKKIDEAKVKTKIPIILSDEKSLFYSNIYVSIKKPISKVHDVKISGKFLTKVFEGHYKNMGKWIKEMKEYVKSENKEIKNLYFYYTTCPKCAKVYGKNYIVIFAEICCVV